VTKGTGKVAPYEYDAPGPYGTATTYRGRVITNDPVRRQLGAVDPTNVERINNLPAGTQKWEGKPPTLGELREYTRNSNREVALSRDPVTGDHYVTTGGVGNVSVPFYHQPIAHTHPSGGPLSPRDYWRNAKNPLSDKSMVVPAGPNVPDLIYLP